MANKLTHEIRFINRGDAELCFEDLTDRGITCTQTMSNVLVAMDQDRMMGSGAMTPARPLIERTAKAYNGQIRPI